MYVFVVDRHMIEDVVDVVCIRCFLTMKEYLYLYQ